MPLPGFPLFREDLPKDLGEMEEAAVQGHLETQIIETRPSQIRRNRAVPLKGLAGRIETDQRHGAEMEGVPDAPQLPIVDRVTGTVAVDHPRRRYLRHRDPAFQVLGNRVTCPLGIEPKEVRRTGSIQDPVYGLPGSETNRFQAFPTPPLPSSRHCRTSRATDRQDTGGEGRALQGAKDDPKHFPGNQGYNGCDLWVRLYAQWGRLLAGDDRVYLPEGAGVKGNRAPASSTARRQRRARFSRTVSPSTRSAASTRRARPAGMCSRKPVRPLISPRYP